MARNENKAAESADESAEVSKGFDNVFEGLGASDPGDKLAKAMIARVIRDRVRELEWSGAKTARALGIAESDTSELLGGKLRRFSQERLEHFLNSLDLNVRILISPKPASQSRASIVVEYAEAWGPLREPV